MQSKNPFGHFIALEKLWKSLHDIELACWGDHFEVDKALSDDGYCARKRELLERHELQCLAISAHLVGQVVLDTIDERHKMILPGYVWGDGNPGGVNK